MIELLKVSPSDCKEIGSRKLEFVAKTQFLEEQHWYEQAKAK